jgi:dUTP pyrophosphatase
MVDSGEIADAVAEEFFQDKIALEAAQELHELAKDWGGDETPIDGDPIGFAIPGVKNTVGITKFHLEHYAGPQPGPDTSDMLDVFASNIEPVWVNTTGIRATIPTGIRLVIPSGYEVQIRPDFDLVERFGVTILGHEIIGSEFRGEIKVVLINLSATRFCIEPGLKIGRMVLVGPHPNVNIASVGYSSSIKGDGGFGENQ